VFFIGEDFDFEVQRFRGSKVQRFSGSKVLRFMSLKVQRFKGSEVQRFYRKERKGSTQGSQSTSTGSV
jgi:hypothetical protein